MSEVVTGRKQAIQPDPAIENCLVVLDLGFCRVGKQKPKLLIILIGYHGDRKSPCAYALCGEEETIMATLNIGISKDLSVRPSSGEASLRGCNPK
jgi:hypothetical protein